MLENTQNLACEFGEQIVDYLYDEMPNAEKPRFEKHLKTCQKCSAELSEFAFTRSAISEWRDVEFSPLVTPKIEIPLTNEEKSSWLASIRNLFTLSPAWMSAATAMAVLAICVGLFAVMFSNSRNDKVIVQQNNTNMIPKPTTEITERTPEISSTNPPVSIQSNKLPKSSEMTSISTPKPVSVKIINNSKTVKAQNLNVVKPSNNVEVRNNVEVKTINKISNKTNNEKSPSLIDAEEEDDSLRLSDILEEVSLR